MKTELIFFDNSKESIKGTTRGLVAFICLIVFDFIYFNFSKKYYYISKNPVNIYAAILSWLLLCSALAVQIPKSLKEATTYGLLVGFVIYGIFNLTNLAILKEWNLNISIIDTLWGTFNCALTSSILYFIFHRI
jgi:uncharacterized membrane protein